MLDRSSATVKLLKVELNELILLTKDCDIPCFLLFRTLQMVDDGVSAYYPTGILRLKKMRGLRWSLMDTSGRPINHTQICSNTPPTIACSCSPAER